MKQRLLLLAIPALIGATPDTASVAVSLEGMRNHKGLVQACLTSDPKAFPNCDKDPAAHRLTINGAQTAPLVFEHVHPGRYAISLLHDENGNGRVDKMLMMPKEGFGFSRNAPVRFGPPSFGSAAFDVAAGAQMKMTLKVRYLL